MESVKFEGCNAAIGEGQEQYNTLHAFVDYADAGDDAEGNPIQVPMDATFCFKLTKDEIKQIQQTGELWVRQLMFGRNFQPILISTEPLYRSNGTESAPNEG